MAISQSDKFESYDSIVGTYDWDELFWDDNDIIERVVPTKITITFMDGTIRTFSGKSNIDKHRMYDCYQEED